MSCPPESIIPSSSLAPAPSSDAVTHLHLRPTTMTSPVAPLRPTRRPNFQLSPIHFLARGDATSGTPASPIADRSPNCVKTKNTTPSCPSPAALSPSVSSVNCSTPALCYKSINELMQTTSPYTVPSALSAVQFDPLTYEPQTFKQASKFPHWRLAMNEEISALHKNKTWHLVPSHPDEYY